MRAAQVLDYTGLNGEPCKFRIRVASICFYLVIDA